MQHYNILRILKGKYPKPSSPGEIKEVMLDKAPDLTRLLDKMVDMGLVDRHLCPDNRRKMDVFITTKGIDLLEKVSKEQNRMYQEDMNNLSEDEAEHLSNLLDKFRG
jgi:DNA-binding MarR family transcriptional regulator